MSRTYPWHDTPKRRKARPWAQKRARHAVLVLLGCLAVAVVLALVAPALCRGADLKITPPAAAIQPGEWAEIGVSGIAAGDLPKAKLILWPRQDARLRGVLTWGGEASLDFRASSAGRYLVAVAVAPKSGSLQYAEAEIQVGNAPEPTPNPPQPPAPDPLPTPGGKYQVAIVYESSALPSLTREQRGMMAGLTFRLELTRRGHYWLSLLEKDQAAVAPANLAGFYRAADGVKSLPCVTVAPLAGGDVYAFPLPKTEAEFWAKLEGRK